MFRRWFARHGWVCAVGLALTLVAVAVHLAGVTERLELLGFDAHVRHFSRIGASDAIVHIDIDDSALDLVGSWPWPRDVQAEVVRILHELGADRIVMDIVWAEPKRSRMALPMLEPYADLEGDIQLAGELSEENIVRSDDELARVIAEAGNVYLAMYSDPKEQEAFSPLQQQIADLLREDFDLDGVHVATRLERTQKDVSAVLPGVKRRIARERVRQVLAADPSATAREVHAAILSTPFDRRTADREDVLAAYHRELGLAQLRQDDTCPPVPAGLAGKIPVVRSVVPPVYKFTAGARGVGFVTFEHDLDGATRRVPLLAQWEDRLIEQLAFRAVRDALDIRVDDLAVDEAGNLVIAARGERPTLWVQLDEHGQMIINWHTGSRKWEACFPHVPVAWLLGIRDCRRQIKQNDIRRQEAVGQAMLIALGEAGFAPYRESYNDMLEQERAAWLARLKGENDQAQAAQEQADSLRDQVENVQRETLKLIAEAWADLQAEPDPNHPEIAEDYKRFGSASQLVAQATQLQRLNGQIDQTRQKLVQELRPLIEGKICFVGYTATSLADMVSTPAYGRAPGVLIHSNTMNSFLQRQFRSWSRRPMQVTVIALFGLLLTGLTVGHGPRAGLVILLIVITATVLLDASLVFGRLDHWLQLTTALGLACIVWALIVLLRYLVTEREKRRFSRAVAQYVSPAMANRIAESAANLDLSPVSREVTCFFSDLQGFTPISETLGPEGTKTVLNPYLEAMSNVLHQHDALINKFMGDGIFAFFNPPILPHAEHERAACEAAWACQRELHALIKRHADHPLAEQFAKLFMRMGLASGPVFVGDYGSENKLDYTCVGDTVNLAARLESANKQFGTAIMVAGPTYDKVSDRYCFRHLGALQVKGQTVGVPVYEMLGSPGSVDDATLRFAETFGRAVGAFARRDWEKASAAFAQCLELRPCEAGTLRYLDMLRLYRETPPPDDWTGSLELTQK